MKNEFASPDKTHKNDINTINLIIEYLNNRPHMIKLRRNGDLILYLGMEQRGALNKIRDRDYFNPELPEFMGVRVIWVHLVNHKNLTINGER